MANIHMSHNLCTTMPYTHISQKLCSNMPSIYVCQDLCLTMPFIHISQKLCRIFGTYIQVKSCAIYALHASEAKYVHKICLKYICAESCAQALHTYESNAEHNYDSTLPYMEVKSCAQRMPFTHMSQKLWSDMPYT